MLSYDNPFKAYVAMNPTFWSEATADSYNALRACLLTRWYWHQDAETLTNDTPANPGRADFTLSQDDIDYMPSHDGTTYAAADYPPILMDIEHWYAFTSQGITEAQAYASFDKARTMIARCRRWFPNRRISWYGWAPYSNWYAVKNYLADPTNASYLSVFRTWQRDNERIKSGGTPELKNNFGPLADVDFLAPDPYMPNDTTYAGVTPWYQHPDALLWHRFFQVAMREARRVWQKPIIPYISPYKPGTTTYLGNDLFTHMMDTAYAERDTIQGFMVYFPSAAGSAAWRDTFKTWVEANLL